METLAASEVSFYVGQRRLLKQVSIEVRPGEVVAVVGQNGAGKSTLLRLFAGESMPSSGMIALGAQSLHTLRHRQRAKRIAVLPQENHLAFPLTVWETVCLGRAPHIRFLENHHDHALVEEALAAAGVRDLAERVFPTLSGGEKLRVHLARVLAQLLPIMGEGKFLLLDEPTSSLDYAHQHQVLSVARRLARDGVGVLVVLHDLNLAARYADRIAVLHDGRIAHEGVPATVLTPDLVQAVFGLDVFVTRHPVGDHPVITPK
jgi:heme transport system ATP-binding protein